MTNHWTKRLSEYLDGDLDAPEREACAEHLEQCDRCARTLEELRSLSESAAMLPDLPPERDLWPDIESRLTPRSGAEVAGAGASDAAATPAPEPTPSRPDVVSLADRRRRVAMTVPQLIAAAVALVVLSAGGMWLALPGAEPAPEYPASGLAGDQVAPETGVPVALTATYEEAVTELEAVFEERREELDPETIRVVVENLAIIDRAITDARQALRTDPSSGFLTSHLASAMKRKVDLLRQVTTIERTES